MATNTDKKPARQAFRGIADEYVKLFHEQLGPAQSQSWWAGNEVGTVLLFCNGDYSLGFEDIRYIVAQNIQWEEFVEWWETNLDYADSSDTFAVNLQSWHHGYRPDRPKTTASTSHRFFVYKEHIYKTLDVRCRYKDSDGEWHDGIAYMPADTGASNYGELYVRSTEQFKEKFQPVEIKGGVTI